MLLETLVFYLLLGIAVAVAVAVRYESRPGPERAYLAVSAVLFWPLYVPLLLTAPRESFRSQEPVEASRPDALKQMIAQVEQELAAALGSLDGWAEEVLARQSSRIEELHSYWDGQAERIRAMDRLLEHYAVGDLTAHPMEQQSRAARSEQARRENFERIQKLRAQAHRDLTDTLAWVRELVSMIHLAKFSGAPAARAEELVAQIAAAVEGLSEVTQWHRPVDELNAAATMVGSENQLT